LLQMGVAMGEWSDMDLGSAGLAYVPSLGLLAGAGKDGILYAAQAASMGQTKLGDLSPGPNLANYAKLAFSPIFFTYYPPTLNPAPQQIETLNVLYDNRTHHQHGAPVSFRWRGPLFSGRPSRTSTRTCFFRRVVSSPTPPRSSRMVFW
jgi:hypothetical protein